MRLIVTSDLHHDHRGHLTSPEQIDALARRIAAEHPDLVVLAGDLGHGVDEFLACVGHFQKVAPRLAVLAGNHDVWRDDERALGSQQLFERELPAACASLGAVWLEGASLRVGEVAIAGSMAWYDYSAIDPQHRALAARVGALKGAMSNDAHWIDWPWSDPELAARLGDRLDAELAALERDPGVACVAVVTHVPLLEEQMIRKPHDERWGVSNAFFGNLTLGDRVTARAKVRLVVSGHTHGGRLGERLVAGRAPLTYAVVPSDYGEPAYLTFELTADAVRVG